MSCRIGLKNVSDVWGWMKTRGRKRRLRPCSKLREVGDVGAFEVGNSEGGGGAGSVWQEVNEVSQSDVAGEEIGLVGVSACRRLRGKYLLVVCSGPTV